MAVVNMNLEWLKTAAGRDWLRTAPLEELVGRQAVLIRQLDTAGAREEYDIIEAAIRGEPYGSADPPPAA